MPYYLIELDSRLREEVVKAHELLKKIFKNMVREYFGENVSHIIDIKLHNLFERSLSIIVTEEERFRVIVFNPEKKVIKAQIESKSIAEGKIKPARYRLIRDFEGKARLIVEGKIPYDELSYLVLVDEEKGICECKAFEIGLQKVLHREKKLGIEDSNISYPCKHVIAVLSIYSSVRKLLDESFSVEKLPLLEKLVRRFVISNL